MFKQENVKCFSSLLLKLRCVHVTTYCNKPFSYVSSIILCVHSEEVRSMIVGLSN